ncbi:MAG: IPT/TIG domain-containing protein [Planctomycetes bacterium]|nr:IPT/TIG domain-containing protein [Planctomycetota bacterium]
MGATSRSWIVVSIALLGWLGALPADAQVGVGSFTPAEVSSLGGTPFEILGSGFTGPVTVRIGVQTATIATVAPDRITGFTPAAVPSGSPVDVIVIVSGVGLAVLPGATTIVGPLDLTGLDPQWVVEGIPTEVRVLGVALTPGTTLEIGGVPVGPVTYVAHDEVRVTVATVPVGVHEVIATVPTASGPPAIAVLEAPEGLVVFPALDAESFAPFDASALGGTPYTIVGSGFSSDVVVSILGVECPTTSVAPTQIDGVIPFVPGADLGAVYDVTVSDPFFGSDVLPNAVRFSGPLQLISLEPSVVPAGTETEILVHGVGFTPNTSVRIDDEPVDFTYLDVFTMRAVVPIADPHLADVELGDQEPDGAPIRVLREAFLTIYDPEPLTLDSADPVRVCNDGGTFVSIYGSGFLPETLFYVNGVMLLEAVVDEDGTRVSGTVPPNSGMPIGPASVTATDFRGTVDGDLLEYVSPCGTLLAPEQFETSLAEGTAWFEWHNPEPYSAIEVLDADGSVIDILAGNATFYELAAPGASQVGVRMRGVGSSPGLVSDEVFASAKVYTCGYPPPQDGLVEPGEIDLVVYGNHEPADVERCSDGSSPTVLQVTPQFAQPFGSVGYVKPQWTRQPSPGSFNDRKLTLGFTLESDAEILEFSAYYRKLAVDFGLALRGHLVHVFPNDGFHDEFTFPDPKIGADKDWHTVTYYRATEDPASADAEPCPDGSGGLKTIPAGEYVLDVYAVGGESALPYYVFGDDPRDVQSLIPGTPCPPYPAIRVRDLTGLRTLPNIDAIEVLFVGELPDGRVVAVLSARGTWFDEDGTLYSVDPFCDETTTLGSSITGTFVDVCLDPPYKETNAFDYCWGVGSMEPKECKVDGPVTVYTFPDWGCYELELTVRDKACGISRTKFQEVALVPTDIALCVAGSPIYSFRFPTPDPGSMVGIVNLQNLGNGDFDGVRPISVRVLVVPQCYCDGLPCAAPQPNDVEFDLGVLEFTGGSPAAVLHPLGADITVTDLCPNVADGPKYYQLDIADIGSIPSSPYLDDYDFRVVRLMGRATFGGDVFHAFGSPMAFANSPQALENAYWFGHFEPSDGSYHFTVQSSPGTEQTYTFPDSQSADFGIADAGIPSYEGNEMAAGFTSRFSVQGTKWIVDDASATSSGQMLGNDTQGMPQQVSGSEMPAAFGGLEPVYQWCDQRTILNTHFSQKLFESLIYAGTVGPVPVNIWASVGLGLSYSIQSFVESRIAPFGELPSGHSAEIQYTLSSTVKISIPCKVTADILGGVASISLGLIPSTTFSLIPSMLAFYDDAGAGFAVGHDLHAELDLDMEAEGCLLTPFGEQCVTVTIPLLDGVVLVDDHEGSVTPSGGCSGSSTFTGGGGGSGAAPAGAVTIGIVEQANMPFSIVSPDHNVVVDGYASEDFDGKLLKVIVHEIGQPDQVLTTGVASSTSFFYYFDPQATFISNDHALIVGTAPADGYVPLDPPLDPLAPDYLSARNQNIAASEIQLAHLIRVGGTWDFIASGLTSLSDQSSDPLVDWRADGRADIAADPSDGSAFVTWVRYQEDYLFDTGITKTIYRQMPGCAESVCAEALPWIRPRMESTAIAVRRVDGAGLVPGQGVELLSDPGINVEPSIAVSPSGNTAYCVWVHDPVHVDLIEDNTGRVLHYAVYDKATDTWSPPMEILMAPEDYPALLEPEVVLSSDDDGFVAFTSLLPGAPTRDSGLGGGSRHLYGVRLVDGVFQAPERIRGRCEDRIYGFGQTLTVDIPELQDPFSDLFWDPAEGLMTWTAFGTPGLDSGSGNVMVSVYGAGEWSPPTTLLAPGRVVSNVVSSVAQGAIHSIHFDGGTSNPLLALGAPDAAGYVTTETALVADAAIVDCSLSHAFPSPGAIVTARVKVENRGFSTTPYDAGGVSAIGLELSFIESDGSARVVESAALPVLEPNDAVEIDLAIEMPHRPVRLRVAISPNPIDRDPSNDVRECFFGAPPPESLACSVTTSTLDDVDGPVTKNAVLLHWVDPVAYDALWLYRDGSMIHTLPGGSTHFVDLAVAAGPHDYQIRGIIGASKSAKTLAICCVDCGPPPPAFSRGEINGDGAMNIADTIFLLDYLFVGGSVPGCFAAADVNADGAVDIADTIYQLGYLFQGGAAPPAPFPGCGVSESAGDIGLGCEEPGC